jgi:hypothetical protein
MKTCAQCHGRLGLGLRSRNVWTGQWWVHLRFCSSRCEARHQSERHDAKTAPPGFFHHRTRKARRLVMSRLRCPGHLRQSTRRMG